MHLLPNRLIKVATLGRLNKRRQCIPNIDNTDRESVNITSRTTV